MTSGRQAKAVGVPIVPDLSASVANFQTATTMQHRKLRNDRCNPVREDSGDQ